MERLKAGAVVWCPFDTAESEFVKVLSGHGFHVIYGHIHTGQDFFTADVPDCDYIVSNPPYSLKGQVIRRLYEIGRPFAMLLNFQGIFDSKERFRMFMKTGWKCSGSAHGWSTQEKEWKKRNGCHSRVATCAAGYVRISWNLPT